MKNKKLLLPTVIMLSAIFLIVVICIANCIALKPTVTEGEFPFSITYEFNGETVTIEDVYYARYNTDYGFAISKSRWYSGKIGDLSEGETLYTLKESEAESIFLSPELYADYMMGDPMYDYFDDEEFAPKFLCYGSMGEELGEEALEENGIKLVSWEYPTPIENSLVFSHIGYADSEIVFPALLVGILALIATLIFVRKDKDLTRKPIDIVSIVFNFLIGITMIPISTTWALLLDALADNENVLTQIFIFLPTVTVLSIAYSVALRRKGYSKSSLLVQFITPAIFAVVVLLASLGVEY